MAAAATAQTGIVSSDLAAMVLALAGIRSGDTVLDLTPGAGLTGMARAAAGPLGSVHADGVTPLRPAGVLANKVLLVRPAALARSLAADLVSLRGVLAPGARVVAAAAPNVGAISDGLPAVLAACSLVVVHAEGYTGPEGRVALAVGRPAAGN